MQTSHALPLLTTHFYWQAGYRISNTCDTDIRCRCTVNGSVLSCLDMGTAAAAVASHASLVSICHLAGLAEATQGSSPQLLHSAATCTDGKVRSLWWFKTDAGCCACETLSQCNVLRYRSMSFSALQTGVQASLCLIIV